MDRIHSDGINPDNKKRSDDCVNVQPDFANKARYKVVLIFNNAQDNAFKREVFFQKAQSIFKQDSEKY